MGGHKPKSWVQGVVQNPWLTHLWCNAGSGSPISPAIRWPLYLMCSLCLLLTCVTVPFPSFLLHLFSHPLTPFLLLPFMSSFLKNAQIPQTRYVSTPGQMLARPQGRSCSIATVAWNHFLRHLTLSFSTVSFCFNKGDGIQESSATSPLSSMFYCCQLWIRHRTFCRSHMSVILIPVNQPTEVTGTDYTSETASAYQMSELKSSPPPEGTQESVFWSETGHENTFSRGIPLENSKQVF